MNAQPAPPLILPPGYVLVPVRTTYLEMIDHPGQPAMTVPDGCEVRRWRMPDPGAYRELFVAVGGKWGWSGRLVIQEEELQAVIQAETNEIYRLFCAGQVAGFAELDRGIHAQVEIAYLGMLAEFIGCGLGRFFLDWTIHKAWEGKPERLWLHTCHYDHPRALATYRRAGFRVCEERMEQQPYAESFIRSFPADGS